MNNNLINKWRLESDKNIFIISGSLRSKSYNKFLASNLFDIGKDVFNFEICSEFNLLPMYNTDDHV